MIWKYILYCINKIKSDELMENDYKKYEPFFGEWYINRLIGRGAFAQVFEIVRKDLTGEYKAALKIITIPSNSAEINAYKSEGLSVAEIKSELETSIKNIVNEIKLMYRLKGRSNIVSYEDHAIIEHKDDVGWDILIRMELLMPLTEYITKTTLTCQDIKRLGIDICSALELCDKHNIVHRDIKPDNIFVSDNGDFKLGDFGIARVIEQTTMELSKKGTYTYMAPEVYKGEDYNSSVDIYSVGMVLYRLMNYNRVPFMPLYPQKVTYSDRENALMKRMSGEAVPLPQNADMDKALTKIIIKSVSYKPDERYRSPSELKNDLIHVLNEKSGYVAIENSAMSLHSLEYINDNEDSTVFMDEPESDYKYKFWTAKKILIYILSLLFVLLAGIVTISLVNKQKSDIKYIYENEKNVVYNTNKYVYVNNVPIPSYMIDKKVVIRAEDLREYGFDVFYDNEKNVMNIVRNETYYDIVPHIFNKSGNKDIYANVLENNVLTYLNDKQIISYSVSDGSTMIPIEGLALFYRTEYDEKEPAFRIWISNLYSIDKFEMGDMTINAYREFVIQNFYKYQDIDGQRIYINQSKS